MKIKYPYTKPQSPTLFISKSHTSHFCTKLWSKTFGQGPSYSPNRLVKEPYEMTMVLGVRPWVQLLHPPAHLSSMCCHKYNWNIVACDVKQPISLTHSLNISRNVSQNYRKIFSSTIARYMYIVAFEQIYHGICAKYTSELSYSFCLKYKKITSSVILSLVIHPLSSTNQTRAKVINLIGRLKRGELLNTI